MAQDNRLALGMAKAVAIGGLIAILIPFPGSIVGANAGHR